MLKKWFRAGAAALAILSVSAGVVGVGTVQAGPTDTIAKGAPWTSSITYQNVGTDPADVTIRFYPGGGASPVVYTRPTQLAAGAGTSLSVGSVTGIDQFGTQGSAVLEANSEIAATPVYLVSGGLAGRNVRPLSNGFKATDASATFLVPTVLNNVFETTSVVAVQNTEQEDITVTGTFYNAADTTAAPVVKTQNLGIGESWIIDASSIGLASGFNGSAVFTAVKVAGGDAKIVATSSEYSTTGSNASSFEGVPQGATKFFMPSALCGFGGEINIGAETAYAIQNSDLTQDATVKITYLNLDGTVNVTTSEFTIGAGQKKSALGCGGRGSDGLTPDSAAEIIGNGANFNGSAVIESTNGVKIVAIGKVTRAGLSTAFVGTADGKGAATLALPYIRWGTDADFNAGTRQRAFIAIQNIGTTDATNVAVKYQDKDGNTVATQTIATIAAGGAKQNSSPILANAFTDTTNNTFGEYSDGSFGGGVLVVGSTGSQLAATVRIQSGQPSTTLATGEDFSGISVGQ